jgi:Lon protease-like protein
MTEIPLFPLSSTLVPHGLMPLQIFEQRYLDLVAECMRSGTGFGVVWLRQGSEVSGGSVATPDVGDYGTYARIVDFDQLPNGLLGITIAGGERFDVIDVWREPSGLVKANVEMAPPLGQQAMREEWRSLEIVLRGLENHPHVQRMNLAVDYDNAWEVAYHLVQLLPFEESIKYELLGVEDIDSLVAELDVLLNQISGEH